MPPWTPTQGPQPAGKKFPPASKNISKIKLDSYSQTSFEDIPSIYKEENKIISKINNIKENSPIKELNKEIKK